MIQNLEMSKVKLIGVILFHFLFTATLVADEFTNEGLSKKEDNVSFSDLFRDKQSEAYVGVVLANFLYIDPDYEYVYIKPQEEDLPRMTVYLDKLTAYSTIKVGKLGVGKKKMMIEGDRVALRVFVKNSIILADEVFLVDGDFGPKARFAKRKYKRSLSASKAAGASEKKSGGGH